MKFLNLTRRTEIGANSYYLEIGGHRLVLDCGMHPKNTGEDALPYFKAIAGRDIEAILISHAHQDHIGTLPVVMRRFPRARVFMTKATAEVGGVLFNHDCSLAARLKADFLPHRPDTVEPGDESYAEPTRLATSSPTASDAVRPGDSMPEA